MLYYSGVYCTNEMVYIPSTAGIVLVYQQHASQIFVCAGAPDATSNIPELYT